MNQAKAAQQQSSSKRLTQKRRAWSESRSNAFWAFVMIAPNLLGLLIFYIWPVFQNLYFSFTDWGYFGNYEWAGLEQYRALLEDRTLLRAARNTFNYTLLTVPASLAISTLLAVLLNQKIRGISIYRTLYFLPVVTMPAATAMVWRWLYNGDYGLINYLLSLVGIEGPRWLAGSTALYSVAIVGIWSSVGYNMIILLGGLQTIPGVYYEAAAIDGAGPVSKFFRITLPLLSPTLFFVSVISIISSLQVFDQILLMIGPTSAAIPHTQSLVYLFYEAAFVSNDKGYGAAIVSVLFVIILLLTALQLVLQKKWVHYE